MSTAGPAITRAAPGGVLISQVLYDPATGILDPGGEWVVLWNPSRNMVRMAGWALRDAQHATSLPEIDLPGGATVLVAAAEAGGSTLPPTTLQITVPSRIGNGLRNAGDSLTLLDGAGTEIDAVSWGDNRSAFDPPVPPAASGEPLRRTGADTDSAADWGGMVEPVPAPAQDSLPIAAQPPLPAPAALPLPAPPQSVSPIEITEPPQTAGAASTSEREPEAVALPSQTVGQVVLSEVAPHHGWIELYNRGSAQVDLQGWSLADGTGTATVMLPATAPVAPHGFLVVEVAALSLTGPDSRVVLRDAAGAMVDIVTVARVKTSSSMSRYPVHGGGWMEDTPLTAGQFNLPAPAPPRAVLATPAPKQDQALAMLPAPALPAAPVLPSWLPVGLPALVGLALLLAIWTRRRP